MKNKKSIAMAMAAVSTLGAVAPAFANEVAPLALTDLTVDYRLANGQKLVEENGEVKVLVGRDSLYNDNFTSDDKTDDTFKPAYKDAEILMTRNTNNDDDTDDLFVLVKKESDASDITMEKAKLDAMIAEIKAAKEDGAKVEVGELTKADINKTTKVFTDSQIIVKVTPKGEATKEYTFNGVPGIKEETQEEVNPFVGLVNEVNVTVADEENITDLEKAAYYNLNKFKLVAEKNKANFDFVKEQDGKDLVIKVYKKGAKQENKNLKFTMRLENFANLEKELVMNISEGTDFNGYWAQEQIEEAMLNGYVDASTKFRPQDGITRAEFAKIACTVFGIEVKKGQNEPFHDVHNGEWYQKYVAALYNKKVGGQSVVQGDGENFRPNDKITRQEVAVIVSKLVSGEVKETTIDVNGTKVDKDVKTKFKDDASIATWADQSVKYLNETAKYTNAEGKEKAIVEGDNGNFNPVQDITRAEALVMVQRAAVATTK